MLYKVNYKKWYIIITLLNLFLSTYHFLINSNTSIGERIEMVITINLAYHFIYFFTGYLTRFQLFMVGDKNPIYACLLKFMKVFGYLIILIGIVVFCYVLSIVFLPGEYQKDAFIALGIPFAFSIGGINLLQNIKQRELLIRDRL